jgi:hypothetical protein
MTAFAATDLHWPAWTEYLAYAGDVVENLYLAQFAACWIYFLAGSREHPMVPALPGVSPPIRAG